VPDPLLGPRPESGALTVHCVRYRQDRSTLDSTPELSAAARRPHQPAAGCPPRRLRRAPRQSGDAPWPLHGSPLLRCRRPVSDSASWNLPYGC